MLSSSYSNLKNALPLKNTGRSHKRDLYLKTDRGLNLEVDLDSKSAWNLNLDLCLELR